MRSLHTAHRARAADGVVVEVEVVLAVAPVFVLVAVVVVVEQDGSVRGASHVYNITRSPLATW